MPKGFDQPSKSSDSSSESASSTMGFRMGAAGFFSRLRLDPSGEGSVNFWGSMAAVGVYRKGPRKAVWSGDGVVGLVVAVIKPHSVGHQTFDSYGSATAINLCIYIVLLYGLWVSLFISSDWVVASPKTWLHLTHDG